MINYCEQVNISGISKENSCVVQKEKNTIFGYQPAVRIEFLPDKEGIVVIEIVINDMEEEGFKELLKQVMSQIGSAESLNGPSIMQYDGIKIVSKSFIKSCKTAAYRIRDKDNKTCGGFDSSGGKYSFTVEKQEMPLSVAFSLLAYTYEIPTLLEKGVASLF